MAMVDVASLEDAPAAEPAASVVARSRRGLPAGVVVALVWLTLVTLAAIFADLLPLPGYQAPAAPPRTGPFQDWDVPLGTDGLGRDILSRLVYGARASLAVSLVAVSVGVVIGGAAGLVAGFYRGGVDRVAQVFADTILAMPALVLLLALAALFNPSLTTLIGGLTVVSIPAIFRIARANTMRFVSAEFVLMARALGARTRRILGRELLPNVAIPVAAYTFLVVAVLIVAEGSLSFLGLGIPPPTPTWGGMIASGQRELDKHPYMVLFPSVVMFATVFSLNVVGDWLRGRLDVRR
jgi:peptide/nickel transport system permease protein